LKLQTLPRRLGAVLILALILTACGAPLAGESWSGISTDGRYVYVADKEQVFRIDTVGDSADPTHRHFDWLTQATNKPHFYAPPAVSTDGGAVYVGAYDHKFYAFNRDKGGALPGWVPPATNDKIVGPATVAGNFVYVGMGDKGIRSFDAKTGAQVASFSNTQFGVWSAPLVVGDTVYFTSLDHNLYALTADTLTLKWTVPLGDGSAGRPVFDNGTLYLGTFGGKLLAIDSTGTDPACKDQKPCVVRSFSTLNNGWVWGSPLLDNGVLYFGDLNGIVYAVDAKTLTTKWTATDKDNSGGIRGSVGIASDVKPLNKPDASKLIIVGSENKNVYAYDARDGSPVWKSALVMNDKILSDMVVVKNDAIFTTLDDNQIVVALNVVSGQIDWQISLNQELAHFQPTSAP
jgi:outer membrane protein assembly factor BamB